MTAEKAIIASNAFGLPIPGTDTQVKLKLSTCVSGAVLIQDLRTRRGRQLSRANGCAILLFRKMFAENCTKIEARMRTPPRTRQNPPGPGRPPGTRQTPGSSARPLRLQANLTVVSVPVRILKVQFSESVTKTFASIFLQNPLITATNTKGNVSDKCLTGRRNSLHLNSANCAFN